ncbi:MAG: PIN domain-containing protein [Anaerolineae bacterium]
MARIRKPTVFLDADVIFAGAAAPSEHGASHVVLRMGEITLIECVTSQQAVTEVERNLADKLPTKLPEFRLLVSRCLRVVPDPEPADLLPYASQSDPKDLPILVTALRERCFYLLTFNVRHYSPPAGTITVQQPGEFLLTVRVLLSQLSTEEEI